jgi:hypothetical protein
MSYRDKLKRKEYLKEYMRKYRKTERELIRLARKIKAEEATSAKKRRKRQ